jgi:predicted MFS family arabinose efflux permease
MGWRRITGGVLGLAAYWLAFYAIGIGAGLLWPEYRDAARGVFQERAFHLFTVPMLITNLLVFGIAGLVAGWLSTRIARSRTPGHVVAALLLIYAVVEHYVLLWDELPPWYNLIVPVVMAGSVWLGCRIATIRAEATKE